jgi:hypothetical protein
MKFTALFTLLLLSVSCMSDHEAKPESFDPQPLSSREQKLIESICSSLDKKERILDVLVDSKYTFSYSHKGCQDNYFQKDDNVVVSLQNSSGQYFFKKVNGDTFAFNFETTKMGAMVEICNNLADLKSPMQTLNSGAIWFTTSTSSEHCTSDYNHVCIHLRRGSHSAGHNYEPHTDEWIKFKIRGQREGFFVERKLISSADCEDGKKVERRATLK